MIPIFTAFFTRGTLYEQEVARLRKSLDLLELPHDIRGIESLGDWVANTRHTPQHVLNVMDDYPDRPIVQLDADAVVWRRPELFERGMDCDIAAHVRRGTEMLNGTLYVAPTTAARKCIELYRDGIAAHPEHRNEQMWLAAAVREMGDSLRFQNLPPEYCYIPDIMAGDIVDNVDPVVSHMQASRERSRCEAWARRRGWIEKWEAIYGTVNV